MTLSSPPIYAPYMPLVVRYEWYCSVPLSIPRLTKSKIKQIAKMSKDNPGFTYKVTTNGGKFIFQDGNKFTEDEWKMLRELEK